MTKWQRVWSGRTVLPVRLLHAADVKPPPEYLRGLLSAPALKNFLRSNQTSHMGCQGPACAESQPQELTATSFKEPNFVFYDGK